MASALWHGFADMGAVEKNGAFVVSRGEGAYIWDREGHAVSGCDGGPVVHQCRARAHRDRGCGGGSVVEDRSFLEFR